MGRRASRAALLPLLAVGLTGCAEGQDGGAVVTSTSSALDFTVNGLAVINGLSTTNGLSSNGLATVNGLSSNGLSSNGLSSNGLSSNGLSSNGLSSNGLATINGLSTQAGLSSTVGLMTTPSGRMTVQYLVRCALPVGDAITKQDQTGASYVFPGQLGLAPGWKNGSCDTSCQEAMSACMLAHVNTSGVHIPLWLVSPNAAIGWGMSPQYPNREGSFFGNIFYPNATSKLVDAFYCNGPGFSTDTVPGRLGATQMGAPYRDPYLSTSDPMGDCSPCASTRSDGPNTCKADGVKYTSPITVWRGQTFQAETATFGNGPQIIVCEPGVCSNGERVGYIGPYSTVTFKNVYSSTTGPRILIAYYANGDACLDDACVRYFNISVNGGAPQLWPFPVVKGGDWNVIKGMPVALAGFVTGTTNTISFAGVSGHAAPDLDWIEVE
jgi:hypothetical protein